MRGVVEIYKQGELVIKEDNLIVDGASELLADIMTISPTLATIESASGILDTSNYTIQAISFGKAGKAFSRNAHYYTDVKDTFINSLSELCVVTSAVPVPYADGSADTSAYLPDVALPKYPEPTDILLTPDASVSGIHDKVPAYSVLAGQNLNLLPTTTNSTVLGPATNSFAVSYLMSPSLGASSNAIGSVLGCYPDSSANGGTNFYMFSSVDGSANTEQDNLIFSGTLSGGFNSAGNMDELGFCRMIMSSVPDATYDLSSSYSGLTISAGTDFSSTGEVLYEVMIASGDARCANLYGGISTMGLWSINTKTCISSGNSPPFTFTPLNITKRAYKLFSKKVFNTDITATFPEGGTSDEASLGIPTVLTDSDIKITWRLKFL
jgi:hypothetical protein